MGWKKKEAEVTQNMIAVLEKKGKEVMAGKVSESDTSGTLYDDIFRRLLEKYPQYVLPLLNEIFHEHFNGEEEIVLLQNELTEDNDKGTIDKIISDVNFLVKSRDGRIWHFHLECQSTSDSTMIVRMFRYDVRIAIRESQIENGVLVVTFPDSAVLCLRSTASTPEQYKVRIIVRNGNCVEYDVPTMKMKNYDSDIIFQKNLHFFITIPTIQS